MGNVMKHLFLLLIILLSLSHAASFGEIAKVEMIEASNCHSALVLVEIFFTSDTNDTPEGDTVKVVVTDSKDTVQGSFSYTLAVAPDFLPSGNSISYSEAMALDLTQQPITFWLYDDENTILDSHVLEVSRCKKEPPRTPQPTWNPPTPAPTLELPPIPAFCEIACYVRIQ